MANHPVSKHEDEPHRDPPPKKVVGEEGSLVLPLAEPSPGAPLVGATSVTGEHIEDGERDPDTIAEEQRRRSALMEAGAPMAEVATTDLPDPRRVAPPVQHQRARDEPRHDNHSRR
jgi:hypothetical protein